MPASREWRLSTLLAAVVVSALIGTVTACDREDRAASGDGSGPGDSGGRRERITIFAAVSTTDAINRITREFSDRRGVNVVCNFGASSTLARQIDQGARADIFLSANPDWMDYLEDRGLIDPATRVDLLGNDLVLIAPRGRRFEATFTPAFDLAGAFEGHLAMGDFEHTPVGMYARASLQHLGWWQALRSRIVPSLDARAAVTYVALGQAGAGIVYVTDARASRDVEVVGVFPDGSHPPIRYPAAVVHGATRAARDLLAYLRGEAAAAVFEEAGFRTLTAGGSAADRRGGSAP